MLQESDDRIVDFLQRMTLKRRLSDHQIQDSMASGKSWPKCWGKHQSARVQLGERLGRKDSCLVHDNWIHVDTVNAGLHCVTICDVVPHVLSVSFFFVVFNVGSPEVPTTEWLFCTYSNAWSVNLPPREQDLLYLHLWVCLGLI